MSSMQAEIDSLKERMKEFHKKVETYKRGHDSWVIIKNNVKELDQDPEAPLPLTDSMEKVMVDAAFPSILINKYQYDILKASKTGSEAVSNFMEALWEEEIYKNSNFTQLKKSFPDECTLICNYGRKIDPKADVTKAISNKCRVKTAEKAKKQKNI